MSAHPPSNRLTPLEKTLRGLLAATTTLMVLCAVAWFVDYFYSLVALLGIVLILTYILLGPVNLMEWGIIRLSFLFCRLPLYHELTRRTPEVNPRILAVLCVYFAFFMALTLGAIQFVPILSKQLGEMGQKIGGQILSTSETVIEWSDRNLGHSLTRNLFARDIRQAEAQGRVKPHPAEDVPVTEEEKEVIQESVLQTTINRLQDGIGSIVPHLLGVVGGTLNGLIFFLAGLMLIFHFLIDGHRVRDAVIRLLPPQDRETGSYLLGSFHQVMFAFIKGQVLLGLLTGVYMYIIYSVFGVPYAFLLGVVFAAAELLPVIGTWIGMGIGLIVILLNMEPAVALWVWACSYVYQTFKDNILAPKVVGDVMGLHPLVIILALLICAKAGGLLGILLALPLASAINVTLRLLLRKDAREKSLQGTLPGGADAS